MTCFVLRNGMRRLFFSGHRAMPHLTRQHKARRKRRATQQQSWPHAARVSEEHEEPSDVAQRKAMSFIDRDLRENRESYEALARE